MENVRIKQDPIVTAIFDALSTGEKCLCELKEIIGVPPTWELYDLRMLEGQNAIKSRTANGWTYYSLAPGHAQRYVRRSAIADEPEMVPARRQAGYDSALEYMRRTMPRITEFESVLRRGF